jgi:WXXGXW repeat (2 copies)
MRSRSNALFSGIFYTVALAFALLLPTQPSQAAIGIGVSINIAPPELPVYEQPPVPGAGYIWTPGYWAWGDDDYYWVPGTWVEAPQPGYLWTPGYWGWNDGLYVWNGGYWGPHIGFYGGVNYGFGYVGHGYEGGYWENGGFRYNSAYNNLHGNVQITNVYNHTVIVENNHTSFNGGHGGIQARPSPNEMAAQHEQHVSPVQAQIQHEQGARSNPALRAAANHGRPPIAATAHAGVFTGQGVVPAHNTPAAAAVHTSTAPAPAPHASGAAPGMAPHTATPAANVQHSGAPAGGAAAVAPAGGAPGGGAPAGHPAGGAPPPHAATPPHATPHPPQHEPAEHAEHEHEH